MAGRPRRAGHPRRSALRAAAAAAVAAALGGCGFELRRPPPMPFSRIALQGFAPRSPLAQRLQRQLAPVAEVVADTARAQVVLVALAEQQERTIVASTATGQVRELQLRLRFGFRVQTPSGRELAPAAQLLLTRDISYSETAALAKELEEGQQYREMQDDIASQVLRRLSSLRL
ncbi:MAG: LPS assembly lipoprotein LptE [Rubrivivax sp.]